jgi:hypothetical protein
VISDRFTAAGQRQGLSKRPIQSWQYWIVAFSAISASGRFGGDSEELPYDSAYPSANPRVSDDANSGGTLRQTVR